MASIIRIKRSSGSSAPAILGDGELAYSSGSGKLYIGFGAETGGGAAQQLIGGKYFADLLGGDTSIAGTATAGKALILDSNKKVDQIYIGNLRLTGNTLSSENSSGDIILSPQGIVRVAGTNQMMIPAGTTLQRTTPAYAGAIRFNTDTTSFEGYSGANWASLGGVKSVDGLTYIIAESSPGASDDTLHFYAATGVTTNVQVATLDATKFAILNTTASTSTTTGALTVAGGAGIAGDLYVGGNLNIAGTELSIGSVTFNNGLTLSGSSTPATEYFTITNGAATPITKFQVDTANGNTTVAGTLSAGASTLSSATISNNASVGGALSVTGNTSLAGTLGVTGATTLSTLSATSGTFSSTLGVTGAATFSSTADVSGNFSVNTNKFTVNATSGNTAVAGTLGVTGNTTLSGTLGVTGNATLSGTATVTGDATFGGNVIINGSTTSATEYFRITDGAGTPVTKFLVDTSSGNTTISGALGAGNTTVTGTLNVSGNSTLAGLTATTGSFSSTLGVTGNTTIGGTLGVTGTSTLAALSATTGSFSSTLSSTGDFAVNSTKFTVAASSGNTAVAGSLNVTGATSLSSTLGVTGNATFSGTTSTTGAATFSSTAAVAGDFSVATNKFTVAAASGNTAVGGTLNVSGTSTLQALSATAGSFSTTLGVTGAATFSSTVSSLGDFSVATNKFTVASATGNTQIAGTLGLTGDLAINTNKFTVAASSGNTAIAGTLTAGSTTLSGNLAMGGNNITGLADPVNPQDAATKNYVDAARSGLDVKQSVRATTTANITLSGLQTVDGVSLVAGDRILVKDQSTGAQNGIYVVATTAWTRASDADANAEVTPGLFTFVEEGTTQASTGWVLTTTGTVTVGTTPLAFSLFSITNNIAAGAGLVKNGNQFDIQYSNGLTIIADTLQVASTIAGAGLTFTSGVVDIVGTTNRITVGADSIDIASTYVGQNSITTLGTITTGVWNGTTIGAAYGGTGLSSYAVGDLLVASGTSTLSKLTVGASGKVLQSNGTTLVYGDVDGGTY